MSSQQCERCGALVAADSFDLHDYCAKCGKNLCEKCMAKGCCGSIPAESGLKADYPDDDK